MGQAIKDLRRIHPPLHCVWCGKIMVDSTWVTERRESQEGRYADAICPDCRTEFFRDAMTRRDAKAN